MEVQQHLTVTVVRVQGIYKEGNKKGHCNKSSVFYFVKNRIKYKYLVDNHITI